MHPSELRCSSDLGLYESLLSHIDVRRANEALSRLEDEGPTSVRRRLLAGSVRLSRRMAAGVHRVADDCVDKLDIEFPLELYVYPSPQTNAACFKPEDGRLFIIFSSNLLETFTGSELRFVMGHELGHHLYRHHDIPIGYLLGGRRRADPRLALDLFAWSRYAEISADRAGAHCAQDIEGVARALFKLASGLSGSVVTFSLDDFLAQVDEMRAEDERPGAGALREDWFATHPFSPLRVKALKLFDEWVQAGVLDSGLADLDTAVQGLMSLMEPSYMEGRTDAAETMRRLLFVGAIRIANASDGISDDEIALFEKFFGDGAWKRQLDIAKIESELPNRLAAAVDTLTVPQRMQVLRDLCLMARVGGGTTDAERDALDEIADGLLVPRAFVCQGMDANLEPD